MNRLDGTTGRRALAAALLASLVVVVVACQDDGRAPAAADAIGDPDHGRHLFVEYGCAACHRVSGVRQADGRVGPDLDGLVEQRIIAGVLPNTPGFLAAFIQEPQRYAPNSGMPDLGVTSQDAGDLTAFLLDGDG